MFKIPALFGVIVRNSFYCYNKSLISKPNLIRPCFVELQHERYFAKGKDKKKESKGKAVKKNIQIDENLIGEVVNVEKMKSDMEHNLHKMKDVFNTNITLRTSVGAIEYLSVVLDGKKHTLLELGQIVRKNPKVVAINMAAFPQALPAALKALSESGMNLNPQQDGTSIFVPVPIITREHRETLSKNAKNQFIKCRDGIRDVQNKLLKTIKSKEKSENLSEDVSREVAEQVKYISDNYVLKAQQLLDDKQSELLGGNEEN